MCVYIPAYPGNIPANPGDLCLTQCNLAHGGLAPIKQDSDPMQIINTTLDIAHHPGQPLLNQLITSNLDPELLPLHNILDTMIIAPQQHS